MKVLIAVDGSHVSEVAVETVARRPWPGGTQVRVLSVVRPLPLMPAVYSDAGLYGVESVSTLQSAQTDEELRVAAQEVARTAEATLSAAGLSTEVRVAWGDPSATIIEDARQWGADLIVVGTHDYRGVQRLLHRSVSRQVLSRAPCSVELVREPSGDPATG